MSEKRFYITDTGLGLDTESDEMYGFGDEEDFCRLFDKLNEQQATIQSLKSDKAIAEDYANIFEKENVKLHKQIGEQQATISALKEENEQLRLELETHKHPLWSTREAERKVNKLADSLADEVKKNGLLNEEINQLRIENMRLKKKGGDEMCKQTCGTCKHFHLDGMFGFWCEKDHDWTLVNGNCSDFER